MVGSDYSSLQAGVSWCSCFDERWYINIIIRCFYVGNPISHVDLHARNPYPYHADVWAKIFRVLIIHGQSWSFMDTRFLFIYSSVLQMFNTFVFPHMKAISIPGRVQQGLAGAVFFIRYRATSFQRSMMRSKRLLASSLSWNITPLPYYIAAWSTSLYSSWNMPN